MENRDNKMEPYKHRCFYQSGEYNSEDRFAELDRNLKENSAIDIPNLLPIEVQTRK